MMLDMKFSDKLDTEFLRLMIPLWRGDRVEFGGSGVAGTRELLYWGKHSHLQQINDIDKDL